MFGCVCELSVGKQIKSERTREKGKVAIIATAIINIYMLVKSIYVCCKVESILRRPR